MTRGEAEAVVKQFVQHVDGANVVQHSDARQLLGFIRFSAMMRDPIRNQPHWGDWVYWWNVLDYAGVTLGAKDYRFGDFDDALPEQEHDQTH